MSLFRFNVLSWLPVLRVPLSSILVFAFVSVISVGFSVVLSSLVSDLVQNLLELFSLQCSVSISQSSVFFSLLQSQSQFQSRLFDSAIPYTNSGSALSLHSVKFVHVFASVIHCRILLCCRVYVSCFEPALLEPQKSWSGCPPRRLQRVCRCASAPDKSEIMVWVSSAAPAKSMPLCLCSRQVRNHGLGVLRGTCKEYADCLYSRQVRNQNGLGVYHGTCNRACGLPLLQTFLFRIGNPFSLVPL